ncbi:MAG TPA: fibrillarin-like rRNA/tRNA 2'-O-methyltransferase [Methanobacterium sp.]|nr:fibrillarin-like rRNA/tRNA 2'-O-methyltransferase [Methanobacterium sp.]
MVEEIQKWKNSSVYCLDRHLATMNLIPGSPVYGEKLVTLNDGEFRLWNPRRSKLAAAILNGLETFPFQENSKILYLGASTGTTPSHISDISSGGLIYCVEFSPRMMRQLADLSQVRPNLIPILDDATKPRNYLHLVEKVDVIYSDVAQPSQTELFMENMRLFLKEKGFGFLMLKARSIDVTKDPTEIFQKEESKLKTAGFHVVEKINLEPYEKDHMAFVCEFGF